jgi:DNA-binding XRE family transcriptional regulator
MQGMSIGKKLRELRGKRTKREVAEAIGVSESSYVKYERDERHPNDSTKVKIAKYFGRSVESIFFN